ncbi:MAG: hypothetical protein ACLUVY_06425 [Bacteroides uniformis]
MRVRHALSCPHSLFFNTLSCLHAGELPTDTLFVGTLSTTGQPESHGRRTLTMKRSVGFDGALCRMVRKALLRVSHLA